jgi:adenylate cyclase
MRAALDDRRGDPMTSATYRAAGIGVLLGLAGAVLGVLVAGTAFGRRIEHASYDRRLRATAPTAAASSPVVIVEINESSIRALEPVVGRWPWPRLVHASAIDYLKRSGAKVIGYDVLFGEREGARESIVNGQRVTGADSDRLLVESVRRAGNVVLLADATFEGLASGRTLGPDAAGPAAIPGPAFAPGAGFQTRPELDLPFADLAGAAAGIGHNYLATDADSDTARRVLPFIEHGGAFVPSLGVAAALAFAETPPAAVRLDGGVLRIGDAHAPLLDDPVGTGPSRQMLIPFHAPTTGPDGVRSTFPSYSFFDVVLSEDNVLSGRDPVLPASAFDGKLVLVGTTAAGTYDRYASPWDGGIAGVEIHGSVADAILASRFMRRAPPGVDYAYAGAAGVAAGLGAALLPVSIAVAVAVAATAVLAAWLTYSVGQGVWIGLVGPAAAAALALFAGVSWRYFVEDREKRQVRRLFGRYVSNDVIDQLMADPSLVRLGGQRRDMSVLFSDIRGFTSASERAAPEAVVAQLNEYFSAMVEVLFRHRGTLDKFVGDMVMGLFGAPVSDPRHADHAVAAALEMTRRLDELNEQWRREGRPALNIGIGINSGEMIAGNIGSEAIMSYTVIGDAVNLGSRLESLNKEYGTRIIISDRTRSLLTIPIETRAIGDVVVKGRTQAVPIFEVVGVQEGSPAAAGQETAS